MLSKAERKTAYWLFAAAASLMLLAAPFVMPSAHAGGGCQGATTTCPG